MKIRIVESHNIDGFSYRPRGKYDGEIVSGEYDIDDRIAMILIDKGYAQPIGRPQHGSNARTAVKKGAKLKPELPAESAPETETPEPAEK